MIHRTATLLIVALSVLGCAASDRSNRGTASDPKEAAVLAFAEPALEERYPQAYHQHKPYVAEHMRNSNIWEVLPASGKKPGAPSMQVVDDRGDLRSSRSTSRSEP